MARAPTARNRRKLLRYLGRLRRRFESVDNSAAEVNGFCLTPRLTLGLQGECWGLQVRYWQMNEPSTVTQLSPEPARSTPASSPKTFSRPKRWTSK